MRAYVFVNSILSPIQQGIQGAHALVNMAVKYHDFKGDKKIAEMFWTWAKDHRTTIFCSAGFNAGVKGWSDFIFHNHHLYPRSEFKEDGDTLGGLTTAVAIVLPERIYTTVELLRKKLYVFDISGTGEWSAFEYDLIKRLAETRLAG